MIDEPMGQVAVPRDWTEPQPMEAVRESGYAVDVDDSPDGYHEHRAIVKCKVFDCTTTATQMITYEANARWPSGKILRGGVRVGVQICEEHFEDLVRGKDIML